MYWGIFYNSKNNFKINKLKITRTSTSWKSDGDILHKHNCLTNNFVTIQALCLLPVLQKCKQ